MKRAAETKAPVFYDFKAICEGALPIANWLNMGRSPNPVTFFPTAIW